MRSTLSEEFGFPAPAFTRLQSDRQSYAGRFVVSEPADEPDNPQH